MMFQFRRRTAALFVTMTFGLMGPVVAQTPIKTPIPVVAQTPIKTPVPIVKQSDLARAERRPAKSNKSASFSSDKKKSKNFSYAYLLPFGVGQFERDKTIMGTALATSQAGFLLMYFERSNSVRASNADAADVMRGVDTSVAGNDPAIVAFLDQNEKFTLQAQKQANMALLGFFALYTAGVVEAVFDPFGSMASKGGSKKKKRDLDFGSVPPVKETPRASSSQLVQDLREEEKASKVGLFVAPTPAGSGPTIGLSVQKPF
jgi:hypothetical protein